MSFVFRFFLQSGRDSKQLFLYEARYVMQKLTYQARYMRQKLIIRQEYFEAYLCLLQNRTIIWENRNCTCNFDFEQGHASQVFIVARQVECTLLVEAPKQNGVCIISHKYLLLAQYLILRRIVLLFSLPPAPFNYHKEWMSRWPAIRLRST